MIPGNEQDCGRESVVLQKKRENYAVNEVVEGLNDSERRHRGIDLLRKIQPRNKRKAGRRDDCQLERAMGAIGR